MEVVRSVSIAKMRGLLLVFLYMWRFVVVVVVGGLLLLGPFLGPSHDLLVLEELSSGELLELFFLSFLLELLVLHLSHLLGSF